MQRMSVLNIYPTNRRQVLVEPAAIIKERWKTSLSWLCSAANRLDYCMQTLIEPDWFLSVRSSRLHMKNVSLPRLIQLAESWPWKKRTAIYLHFTPYSSALILTTNLAVAASQCTVRVGSRVKTRPWFTPKTQRGSQISEFGIFFFSFLTLASLVELATWQRTNLSFPTIGVGYTILIQRSFFGGTFGFWFNGGARLERHRDLV